MICLTCGRENDAREESCRFCGSRMINWQSGTRPAAGPARKELAQAIQEPRYAGFWRRFLAIIIDEFLLGFVSFVFSASYFLTSMSGPGLETYKITATSNGIFSILLHWLYFTIMESCPTQATLGKMAIGIVVTDYGGRRISFLKANGRYFGKFLSALFFGIGFIMAGITRRKQALHDMLAKTLVVMK
jgi:uncharacterized RDD family membrane protein YckC